MATKLLVCISSALCSISLLWALLKVLPDAQGHARLMEPPGRSSLWRLPEFHNFTPPVPINVDDNQLYCGGFATQHDQNNGRCGLCGDSYSAKRPRPNESGGQYDAGFIVRNYTMGQLISTASYITANHGGFFDFSICPRNSSRVWEEEECFDQNPIPLADGSGYRVDVSRINVSLKNFLNTTLRLPPGITCSHCVFRWQYITGNRWGICPNETHLVGTEQGHGKHLGCGAQETYRACAEVSIQ